MSRRFAGNLAQVQYGFRNAMKRVADAYLAGFALAGGHSFVTLDKGFRNFEELDSAMLD